ncbi:MAG: hypothetical protein KDK72_10420 [Chlamydiia bacterium]|nr:hypothetical protein [Chlamydiia bacterium]
MLALLSMHVDELGRLGVRFRSVRPGDQLARFMGERPPLERGLLLSALFDECEVEEPSLE